jgi:hypothetical protein
MLIDTNEGSIQHNKQFFKSGSAQFESWFYRIFIPIYYAPPYNKETYLYDPHQRTSCEIYTRTEGQHTYQMRIRYLGIIDQNMKQCGRLYLLSSADDDNQHRCVYSRINQDNPTVVELHDLILAYDLQDLHETPPKLARVYVQTMTQFLIDHHRELGINQVIVVDHAHYRCLSNRQLSIHLEQSRQLEGQEPYYMQFGYLPESGDNRHILQDNQTKMSHLLTKDVMDLVDQQLLTYQEQPLSQTMKDMSHWNSVLYSSIYETIFQKCGLVKLDNPIYIMRLN